MEQDSEEQAEASSSSLQDPRVAHWWDPDRQLGRLYTKALGLGKMAWDVYLLYAPGVEWTGELPPQPSFWMHQLSMQYGTDPALRLEPGRFSREIKDLLNSDIGKAGPDLPLMLHGQALVLLSEHTTTYTMSQVVEAAQHS